MRCIQIGLLCVQGNSVHRPTMAAVMLMLSGSIALPLPSVPAMSPHDFDILASYDKDARQSERSITKSIVWHKSVDEDLYPR